VIVGADRERVDPAIGRSIFTSANEPPDRSSEPGRHRHLHRYGAARIVRRLTKRAGSTSASARAAPRIGCLAVSRSSFVLRPRLPGLPDHERVEVPSDDVAMGASDPAIRDARDATESRTLWGADPIAHVPMREGSWRDTVRFQAWGGLSIGHFVGPSGRRISPVASNP
jgi:hypothetical protein